MSVDQSGHNDVILVAGLHETVSTRKWLPPLKLKEFRLNMADIRKSHVLVNMFRPGGFTEGIERRAVFPTLSANALSFIVQYLQGRPSDPPDLLMACELLLVGEYFQIVPFQRFCSKSIAKQFFRLRSFGLLPDHLTRMILRELDTLHLCMAEQILIRERRVGGFDMQSLWCRMFKNRFPKTILDHVDPKSYLVQHYIDQSISLYQNKASSDGAELKEGSRLGGFWENISLMAPYVLRLTLRNPTLNEATLYSIVVRLGAASELHLEMNQLGPSSGKSIARAVRHHSTRVLTELDLADCQITAIGLRAIASSLLQKPPRLAPISTASSTGDDKSPVLHLFISSNPIGDAFLFELSNHVLTVTSLNISNNNIGERGAEALAMVITNMRSLKRLFANGCDLGGDGVISLVQALIRSRRQLSHLAIAANIVQTDRSDIGHDLHILLNTCSTLEYLDIGGNKLRTKNLLKIGLAIRSAVNLRVLCLGSVHLERAIQTLGLGCQYCRTLSSLIIADSCLSPQAMVFVASIIAYTPNLSAIDISGNDIDGNASEVLASALGQTTTLSSLTINGSSGAILSSGSAINIINGLSRSVSIQKLSLSGHSFGNPECVAVIHLISSCRSLQYVNLAGNRLSDHGLEQIAAFLSDHLNPNTREVTLDFRQNGLTIDSRITGNTVKSRCPNVIIIDGSV